MFDALKNLGGLGNIADLMKNAGAMKEKMRQIQDDLARKQFTADAGGGIVTAVVSGRLELLKVRINKSKADLTDVEMLEDVIVAAVAAAQARAAEAMKQEMQNAAAELGLPPGMLGL